MEPLSRAVLWRMALVAGGYYLGAWYGVNYTIAPGGIAVLWPPNAVLLTAFLLWPRGQWPWIALAAMFAECIADIPAFPVWAAVAFGLVNLFEAALAAFLIRRLCGERFAFDRLYSGRAFLLCGPLFASVLAALLGALIYVLLDRADGGYLGAWRTWWFGDALGLLVFTPLFVTLARWLPQAQKTRPSWRGVIEFSAQVALVLGLGVVAFPGTEPAALQSYFAPVLLLPVGLWAAVRFEVLGATVIVALISMVAVAHLVQGIYPRPQLSPTQAVELAQEYLAIVAVVSVGMAILMHELRQQREKLRDQERELHAHNALLEMRIAARTSDLEHANAELQRANRRLEELATTDFLTGFANRRHFEELAQRELKRLSASGDGAALVMFDLDHFKQVNDRYGHEVGDEVLRRIGRPVRDALRPRDPSGRSGGEEFVVLLPQADGEQACKVADRIRADIEALTIEYHGQEIRLTASFGVAEWDGRASLDRLLQQADEALYRAKRLGRNRVEIA